MYFLLFGRVVLAQNATLNGTVLDNAGAAVPGAHITVVNTGTNATQAGESNDQGVYSIGQLAPGSYTVTVERTGFRKAVETGIVLTVNQSATLNIPLQIGDLEQTISVSADAALINATTAEISTVVDQHAISQLR